MAHPPDDEPSAFADLSDVLREVREQYPEWEPPDPYDAVVMREACDEWWDKYIEISDEQDHRTFTRSDELKRFLVSTEALARAAAANGLDSEPLLIFLHDAKEFYYKLRERLPTGVDPAHLLVDQLKFRLDAQQHASRPHPTPPSPTATVPAPPLPRQTSLRLASS
jgi:hypothetical protein